MPGDYDDYWYNDGGEWYNEYDDELEEGYYYTKERKLPSWCTDNSLAIPKPSDYEDYWYEAEDGQWYNEYDETGQEYEDSASDISLLESRRNCAKNVSFDQTSRVSLGGRVSPRQRWQWAYTRIRQVGDRVGLSLLDLWLSRCCKSQCLLFVLM